MQSVIPGKYVIILATLLASAQLGAAVIGCGDINEWSGGSPAVNDCGDSTFTDQSSSASPTVADCQQITRNIANGGTWTIVGECQRTLVTFGTCAFGVTPRDVSDWSVEIGNEDIIDLINSSIQMFTWFGLVGSEGSMPCSGGYLDWGIYHT